MLPSHSLRRLAACLMAAVLLLSSPAAAQALPDGGATPEGYLRFSQAMTAQGWSLDEGALLWDRLGPQGSAVLLSRPRTPDLAELALQPAFRPALLQRYLDRWTALPQLTAAALICQVNGGLDRPFYQNGETVADPAATDVLVNKYHRLPADYVPDLVALGWPYASGSNQRLAPQAAQAFMSMADGARQAGLQLRSVSAYRAFDLQASLYARYVRQDGMAAAESYSARPGWSEHQTGLALDINVASISARFEDTPEFAWLSQHCWRYGFILRYPQGAQERTGYTFEPWHYRYVGVETALAVQASGLTYDEFVATRSAARPDPVVLFQGQALALAHVPVVIGERLFLCVDDALTAMGRIDVLLSDPQLPAAIAAAIPPDMGESSSAPLTPLWQDGTLYLPLDELVGLVGHTVHSTDRVWTVEPTAPMP